MLSARTKLAYGIGGLGDSIKTFGFTTFLLFYYTTVLGLSAMSYVALLFGDFGFANAELYRGLASECMAFWAILLGLGTAMRHGAIKARRLD